MVLLLCIVLGSLSLLVSWCLGAPPAVLHGRVLLVHDGDTCTVATSQGVLRVRLAGIDAPELSQPYGRDAQQWLEKLAAQQHVTLTVVATDQYGRTIARLVRADGIDLSGALVLLGAAWWYRAYASDNTEFAILERLARAARRGLWADPKPIPPWKWRERSGQNTDQNGPNLRVYASR